MNIEILNGVYTCFMLRLGVNMTDHKIGRELITPQMTKK
jgi:hypothetical protein